MRRGTAKAADAALSFNVRVNDAFAYSWPRCRREWRIKAGSLDDCVIWALLGGEGTLEQTGASRSTLKFGDCLLLMPGLSCVISQNPEKPLTVLTVHFDFVDGRSRELRLSHLDFRPALRSIGDFPFLLSLLERVVSCHSAGLSAFAGAFLRGALAEAGLPDGTFSSAAKDSRRKMAIDYCYKRMAANPEREYSLSGLAAGMGLSRARYLSLVKGVKGVSPKQHQIRSRIDSAKIMLKASVDNVKAISGLLGYNSVSFFCRQFKKSVGVSPARYRSGK